MTDDVDRLVRRTREAFVDSSTGVIEAVLPLDDAELLQQATPVTASGVKLDSERLKARHDAQLKTVMDSGGFCLTVLGGAHDLTDSVRWLGHERCEYIRVTTNRFHKIGE